MNSVSTPSIDPACDRLIPVNEICKQLPKRPSPATRWRWIKRGVRGIKLPALRCNGVWCTTAEAWRWFHEQRTSEELRSTTRRAGLEAELKAKGLI